jgi:hypothetical protein
LDKGDRSTGGKRIGKQYILSIYEEDREDFTAAPVNFKK